MTITPDRAAMNESIEAKLRRAAALHYVEGSRFQRQHVYALMTRAANEIDRLRAQVADLDDQLADMRRDLSDARSGWESAVAEVRELEAREATDCPHIRPYMTAVDDAESFESWLSRASDAELRCAVALQRGEIDRLRDALLDATPTPLAQEMQS